jgi:periplasmic protein CpxP/Spy
MSNLLKKKKIRLLGGKEMRRILGFSVIIIVMTFTVTNAQNRRTPEERAKMLKERLNLTDEQTSKVDSIYTESDKKFQDVSQNGFDRAQFRAIMDSTNSEIEKLLTDKQKDGFSKLLEERRNRMHRNNPN